VAEGNPLAATAHLVERWEIGVSEVDVL